MNGIQLDLLILLCCFKDTSCRKPWPDTSVLCEYKNDDHKSVNKTGVSEADIALILAEHNRYRSAVNPTATSMQKMVSLQLLHIF